VRDPRLREAWALARADERGAATERRLAMATTTDRAEIERLLAEWWTDVLAQDSTGEQWATAQVENLRRKCSSLSPGSRNLGLTAPDTLARSVTDADRGVGALLLGESAAAAVRVGSSSVPLNRAVDFLSECWEAVEVMMEALLRTPAWPASTEILAPANTPLDDLLGRSFDRAPPSEVLLDEERNARDRGLLAYFWGHRNDTVCLNYSILVRLTLVAARDWQHLARLAEALPLREFREDLWQRLYLREDRDAILALLHAAPPVFDTNMWTGNTSALSALSAAITHAEQLHSQLTRSFPPQPDSDEKIKNLVAHELPEWLNRVAQAAIARSDGRFLLLFFGASLIRTALRPPWNGQRSWSAALPALCAIHEVLDPKPSVDEIRQVADLGGVPGNRSDIDHATYLVTAATFDACASDVWAWYRELLLQSDDELCWQAKNWRRNLCYGSLAERLLQLSHPLDKWRSVWKELFVTDRERARFATLDHDALHPSLHLLRVGAELLRQSPLRTGSRQFYEEMLAHIQHLLANDPRFITPFQPELVVDAIDVAPRVLGSDWPQALEPHRPLLSNTRYRIYVAALLLQGGASFRDVEATVEVAPHRLTDSIAELKQSNVTDRCVHHLCEIVAACATQ
jgi:hypothetical protein